MPGRNDEEVLVQGDPEVLRELVRKHRVYLEVEPRVVVIDDERVQIAADLKLWGAHPRSSAPRPDCSLCHAIHQDLLAIASSVLPAAEPKARVLPFDRLLYASDRWGRDEIDLTVRIEAREGQAAGPEEDLLLRRMRSRLESLGVFAGGWRPSDL